MQKKNQPKPKRKCRDCPADLAGRHGLARYCIACSIRRSMIPRGEDGRKFRQRQKGKT